MTTFRFSGCRHRLGMDQLAIARDGDRLRCEDCGGWRTVREVEDIRALARRRKDEPYIWSKDTPTSLTAEDIRRTVQQAQGKGQLALLVTDAAGVVIAGIRATGGLTQLQYRPQDGTWEFHGAFSGPEILEGSYVLRDLGLDPEPQEPEYPDEARRAEQGRQLRGAHPELYPDSTDPARTCYRCVPPLEGPNAGWLAQHRQRMHWGPG